MAKDTTKDTEFEILMDLLVLKLKKVMPSACSECRVSLEKKAAIFVTEKHHYVEPSKDETHLVHSHYRGYCIGCYEKTFESKIDEHGFLITEKEEIEH